MIQDNNVVARYESLRHCREPDANPRRGKILVLLVVLLPILFGIVGLVIDGGLIMDEYRVLQHATDAAATAAAVDIRLGKASSVATATAEDLIHNGHNLSNAAVTVNIPPTSGNYAGQATHAEVIAVRTYHSRFMQILDGIADRTIQVRSVAGVEDATTEAAIVVLDPNPAETSVPDPNGILAGIDASELVNEAIDQSGVGEYLSSVPVVGSAAATLFNAEIGDLLPDMISELWADAVSQVSLPALPTLTAGMEVEGLGRVIVDGAVHVNCEWGGEDENGDPAGAAPGPPYGLSCMPILSTTQLAARDIRVVGGVDNKDNYEPFDPDESNPLQANRLDVPDPFQELAVPSASSDPGNVDPTVATESHYVRVALSEADADQLIANVYNALPALLQPLFQPLADPIKEMLTETTLQPGVYDSITVISPLGGIHFEPGVYIVRNVSPITQMSLCIVGPVEADGVLFYITDSAGFDATTGTPDEGEAADDPPANPLPSSAPSAVIFPLLATASISGLNDPGSPFDNMLVYQRRLDRRPIVIEAQQLVGSGMSGTVYAKWAHVAFIGGNGSYDMRFVSGTLRLVTASDSTIAPTMFLPAAQDVFLVE